MTSAGPVQPASRSVPTVAFAGVVVLVLLVLGSPIAAAWNESPDLGHGWALPWLMGWLLWERRFALTGPDAVARAQRSLSWIPWAGLAVSILVLGALRLLLGAYPLLPTALWTWGVFFAAFALGAALFAGGRKAVIAMAVPVALVFTGLPWPSSIENALVLPLREGLTWVTVEVLNLAGVPALGNGTVIQIPGGTVGVDEACGGMRSLQASLMIALFAGEAVLLGWGRRVSLLALAIATAVFGNLLRVAVLTFAATTGGEPRLQAWHDPTGYVALACILVVVGALAWKWSGGAKTVLAGSARSWPANIRVSRGKIVWAAVALVAALSIELSVRGWFGSRLDEIAEQPEWRISWPQSANGFREDKLGPSGVELLRADSYAAASWVTPEGNARSAYFIEWRTGQKARFLPLLHSPEICLPMTGNALLGRFETSPLHVGGFDFPFVCYEFSRAGQLSYVFSLLWDMDEGRAFIPTRAEQGKVAEWTARWNDVRAKRARVRVQVCTYQILGAANRDEAVAMLRREIEGGFITVAPAATWRATPATFGQIR